ncbi:MAG: OsmC family protein [Rhodospirillaceae bacterium]|jgi:putative redox protein|nr:OsmC family protein [Rhodospirillaceae bacterium]MBT3493167.1 OsmC family protein [Rhodospirillaceae bacterium]MBT3782070.1 OsmC family protein [Rhodospirillaceae bacterium]MBT3977588.1 OsmC family protein [Rhodospirillaceae bacterium]MBT4166596.1 OsmC family protein [Rhodospirillaceae bacterium]
MAKPAEIKAAMERTKKIFSERPSKGRATKSTTAEMVDGIHCRITDGEFTMIADLPKAMGGDNIGPSPGSLARAGLAACLTGGYAMYFAARDIPVDHLSVEVTADIDYGSFHGLDGTTAGFQELCYTVNVDSPADPADILAAIEVNDAGSIVLNSFTKPVPATRDVRINQQQQDAGE